MVFRITPPMVPGAAPKESSRDYLLIGVALAHISPGGTVSFDTVDASRPTDADGKTA